MVPHPSPSAQSWEKRFARRGGQNLQQILKNV